MRYYILGLLFFFFSSFLFVACDNSDDVNDKQAPQITNYEVNDTLYLDSLSLFIGEFSDNHKLSSYKVRIIPLAEDTFRGRDSMMLITFNQGGNNIFGEQFALDTLAMRLPKTEKYKLPSETTTNTYHVIPGEYFFQVSCIDVSGNRDSIGKNITILYKNTISNGNNNQGADS